TSQGRKAQSSSELEYCLGNSAHRPTHHNHFVHHFRAADHVASTFLRPYRDFSRGRHPDARCGSRQWKRQSGTATSANIRKTGIAPVSKGSAGFFQLTSNIDIHGSKLTVGILYPSAIHASARPTPTS